MIYSNKDPYVLSISASSSYTMDTYGENDISFNINLLTDYNDATYDSPAKRKALIGKVYGMAKNGTPVFLKLVIDAGGEASESITPPLFAELIAASKTALIFKADFCYREYLIINPESAYFDYLIAEAEEEKE